jgi:hypothetical protein
LQLLDGRNRLEALELISTEAVERAIRGAKVLPYGTDPYQYVLGANVTRRHLSNQQKLDLITAVLQAQPSKPDRQIARETKTSHPTVAKQRAKAEAAGLVESVTTRTDSLGRNQPAHKVRRGRSESSTPRKPKPQVEGRDFQSEAARAWLDDWDGRPKLTAEIVAGMMPAFKDGLRRDLIAMLGLMPTSTTRVLSDLGGADAGDEDKPAPEDEG